MLLGLSPHSFVTTVLEHLQTDDQVADIIMAGRDKSCYLSVKAELATHSEFFKLTFCGTFKETTTEPAIVTPFNDQIKKRKEKQRYRCMFL